jgi:hypothetical protein
LRARAEVCRSFVVALTAHIAVNVATNTERRKFSDFPVLWAVNPEKLREDCGSRPLPSRFRAEEKLDYAGAGAAASSDRTPGPSSPCGSIGPGMSCSGPGISIPIAFMRRFRAM